MQLIMCHDRVLFIYTSRVPLTLPCYKNLKIHLFIKIPNFVPPSHVSPVHYWHNDTDRSAQRKTCPSATLSTTNLILNGLALNSGLHSEQLATSHPSHGMTYLTTHHLASIHKN